MTQPEHNPEVWVSDRARKAALLVAKVALFDEMIDYHLDGTCTFEQAVEQYKHDLVDLEAA